MSMAMGNRLALRFADDGCVDLVGLFDPELIDAARLEFESQFDLSNARPAEHLQVGHRRLQLPIEVRGPIADAGLSAHPLLLAVVGDVLGADLAIDSVTCVVALPGAKSQALHRDHPGLKLRERFAVTVAVPLINLTDATGSTLLFPGSHVRDDPPVEGAMSRPAYLGRGDCFLMDYTLWHQGMPNRSDQARPVLYFVFARPWFTDDRNFKTHAKINVELDTLMNMPVVQRRLFRRAAVRGGHDLTEARLLGLPECLKGRG
jgi:hypothetical protein